MKKAPSRHCEPDSKTYSIQKPKSGMILTALNDGCADKKVTIYRTAQSYCLKHVELSSFVASWKSAAEEVGFRYEPR